MLVKLPGSYRGHEIVKALKEASDFAESKNKRWEGQEFIFEFQYEPGSAKQTVRSMGIRIGQYFLGRKCILWGSMVWKREPCIEFRLRPLVLQKIYKSIEVDVEYVYDMDQGGYVKVATNPKNPHFEDIRSPLEKILAQLFSNLQKQAA